MITTPIFTRIMDTSEYGGFSVFTSWQVIAGCVVTLTLYGGVYIQAIVKFEDERDKISSSFQSLTLLLVLVWAVIYLAFQPVFARITGMTRVEGLLLFVCIWISAVFSFWAQEQRSQYKYRRLVAFTLLHSVLSPGLSIVFILYVFPDKVFARILGVVLSGLICYLWMFFEHMGKGKSISVAVWKYALRLAIPLVPHYLSQTILNNSDRIMIEKLVGKSQAGIYNLAYSIAMILVTFNAALHATVEPWIYRRIRESEPEEINNVAHPLFIFVAAVDLLLIIVAPEVLAIFAPPKYYEAVWIIPPVAMGVFFMFTYSFFATFEFYYEKSSYITIATLTGAIINLITNYFFIQAFGYMAAGYTTLLCYIIYALMHYLFMHIICKKKFEKSRIYDFKTFIKISVVFLICGFAIMQTYRFAALRYALLCGFLIFAFLKREYIIGTVKKLASLRMEK